MIFSRKTLFFLLFASFLVIASCFSSPASAEVGDPCMRGELLKVHEDVLKGVEAYFEGDSKKAADIFLRMTAGGKCTDPVPYHVLIILFTRGDGVPKDISRVYMYTKKYGELIQKHNDSYLAVFAAAEQYERSGSVNARLFLADMYQNRYAAWGDSKRAADIFLDLAKQGNVYAEGSLSNIYFNGGKGVEQDYVASAMWAQRAAEHGSAWSQNNLAYMYEMGLGVEKDIKKAEEWYLKAAAQGLQESQHSLGDMYYRGSGVAKNYKDAAMWFHKAAANGHVLAQYNLGWMYHCGDGVTRDIFRSYIWNYLAYLNGSEQAGKDLNNLKSSGLLGYAKLNQDEITAAKKMAVEMLKNQNKRFYMAK